MRIRSNAPRHVIFSGRAFTSLLAETKEKILTETGGIFLGVMSGETWYVVEAIDPGPKSIFQPAYFEYDGDYVRHLANKVNRLYSDRLDVLGLWHRHPGSMDTFSRTDDETIKKFAEQNNGVTISALVNIDPKFRLTMYAAALNPYRCTEIGYEIDDEKVPIELRGVDNYRDLEAQINYAGKSSKADFKDILLAYLRKSERFTIANLDLEPDKVFNNSEDDCDYIIERCLVDECLFGDENNVSYICDCTKHHEAELIIGNGKDASDLKFSFYMIDEAKGRVPYFVHDGRLYPYKGNMLKSAWEGYRK